MVNYALLSSVTFIEHRRTVRHKPPAEFPLLQWGTSGMPGGRFLVERIADSLRVTGFDPFMEQGLGRSWDLFERYRKAPKNWSAGITCKSSPHLQFANADTDDKLCAFVRQFGPVVASSVREEPLADDAVQVFPILVAEQHLGELRNERELYHSALTLLSEFARGKVADVAVVQRSISAIADKVSDWPRQCQREKRLRRRASEPPITWEFSESALKYIRQVTFANLGPPPRGDKLTALLALYDPVRAGHNVLCELVNAFKPLVYLWGNSPSEAPHLDLRYGIRPVLYFILRREYVNRGGIAVCGNTRCRELFEIERVGQRFCGDTCSQHQRQREYWAERGKKLRNKRRKQEKAAKKAAGKRR